MSVRALRQVVGLTPVVGCPSSVQDVPLALLIVKASTIDVVVAATHAPPPPLVVLVQEVAPVTTEVSVSAALAGSVVAPSSTVTAPILNVGVVTTSAPEQKTRLALSQLLKKSY